MCFPVYTKYTEEHGEVYTAIRAAGLTQRDAGMLLKRVFGLTSVLDAKRLTHIAEKELNDRI